MTDDLFCLICEIDADSLFAGHIHDRSAPPARCITTILDPEDNNMGDEAFIDIDAYM